LTRKQNPSLVVLLGLLSVSLAAQTTPCPATSRFGDPAAGAAWTGWGAGLANTRYQDQKGAGIAASDVSRLTLKWAFGFPGAKSVYAQPSVAAGRVFVGVDTGAVYSLDAATGCVYWMFQAETGMRSAVSIERPDPKSGTKYMAYFGDSKANVYALDAATGAQVWKVHVDDHASAKITGAPKVFEGRVYVPVASGEEGAGPNRNYACCTFRGSVVALDAATGKQIWKTYTIAEEPKPVGKNTNGVQRFAPAGAGVWNSPTIDAARHALYIGTGDAYTLPAANTTDAIIAMDLNTGKILWSVQDSENDAWLAGCNGATPPENCPKDLGPDHDFGAPPILKTLPGGRTILIAGQKSGNVWAHDPDNKGKVIWKTALVNNTSEFGGKIVWGGAVDDQNAYFGLGPGGIAAVQLRDGERKWFTQPELAPAMAQHPGHEGPLTAIPGIVFSGGWDGIVRALSAADGKIVWQYNTIQEFTTVNGVTAKGGSMGAAGPVVAGGILFVPSGYVGVRNGIPGNVLLALGVE
jgi:polyvinyl alcohol dehydrogenase (cytochrome)